jgi:hypothetical protein
VAHSAACRELRSATSLVAVPSPSKALVVSAGAGTELIDTPKVVVGIPGFWLQAMKNNQVCVVARRDCM